MKIIHAPSKRRLRTMKEYIEYTNKFPVDEPKVVYVYDLIQQSGLRQWQIYKLMSQFGIKGMHKKIKQSDADFIWKILKG